MDELNSSELGTREYWQEAYKREISNFEDNGDTGDVWFGEDSAYRVVQWIANSDIGREESIIDLGCGNGYTLLELAKEGFTKLLGVDYCQEALTLAEKVTKKEFPFIDYKVFDLTNDSAQDLGQFKVVHDKGTYDAISLNPDNAKNHRESYAQVVSELVRDDGVFIITSCNWTDDELRKHFAGRFKLKSVIPTPQFKFGGKVGSVVSSVVFVKDK